MGAKITVPEMQAKTDEEILNLQPKIVTELKPEVKKVYDDRIAPFSDDIKKQIRQAMK